jgi:hypothetical protein
MSMVLKTWVLNNKILASIIVIVLFFVWFYLSFLNYNYSLYVKHLLDFNDTFNLSNIKGSFTN